MKYTNGQKMYTIMLANKGYTEFLPVTAGIEYCEPDKPFAPTIRDYYLIHFVTNGNGKLITAENTYQVSEGQAFIIHPNELCTYGPDRDRPWTYMWIGFTGRLADKFGSLPAIFEFDQSLVDELGSALREEYGCEEYMTAFLFKLYATLFSSDFSRNYVKSIKSYINANYMQNISISGISDMLKVNRKYLARIFKAKTGISMKQYLIEKRMNEAKRLLSKGFTVEESAIAAGYSDSFVFSKAFKKHFGKSPAFFKNK